MIKSSEDIVIGDLISRRVPFFVPKYQRNYSWDEDEVSDFIEDVSRLCDRRMAALSVKKHFFGGLVSIDSIVPQSMSGRAFELVDGQQRMATFVMAISLLAKAFRQLRLTAQAAGLQDIEAAATAQAQLVIQNFLVYQEVIDNKLQDRYRVTLSKADAAFFQQILEGHHPKPTRQSHNLLENAYARINLNLFQEKLLPAATSLTQQYDNLMAAKSALCEDCHVIHIYSDDRKEAYSLFRILNDRGRPLGDGDKLRSHTLESLEPNPALQNTAEQEWDDILDLGQGSVDDFLQAFFTSQLGEKAPKRELFDKFVEKLLTPPQAVTAQVHISQKVSELRAAKADYLALLEGEWPYSATTVSLWKRERLSRLLQVLRHSNCLPLLMAVKAKYSEPVFTEVVLLLEKFAFRYVSIVGGHHNPPNTVYANTIRDIRGAAPAFTPAILRIQLSALITRYADDAIFGSSLFAKLKYSFQTQRRLIKHFLTTVDDHSNWLASGALGSPVADETRVFDVNTNTIEHIYPQNPLAGHVDPAMEPLKQDLPNLSFWGGGDNQAAGNLPFIQKKLMYQASSVAMNRELANLAVWNAHEYMARSAAIWDAAQKIFAL